MPKSYGHRVCRSCAAGSCSRRSLNGHRRATGTDPHAGSVTATTATSTATTATSTAAAATTAAATTSSSSSSASAATACTTER